MKISKNLKIILYISSVLIVVCLVLLLGNHLPILAKGALCKYCNSLEERLLNCDALRAFLRPGLESMDFSWTKNSVI